MCCADDEQKGGKSRFKVEFVDESRKKGQVNGWDSPRDVQKSSGHVARHAIGRERRDSGRSGKERWDNGRSGDRKVSEPDSPVLSVRSMSPTNTYVGYDTHNLKTFGHNTHEALPHVDHYRNLLSSTATHALKARPTLDELHEEKEDGEKRFREPLLIGKDRSHSDASVQISPGKKGSSGAVKFGWIKGVLIRCLLNIWGVMLFLRLSWVVGQAGVGLSTLVVLLSSCVTTITALSMAAICTNGEVKGGGAYFMISRSLGPEFGGAIGLIFSVANAVAVAMYVVGFAETVRDILKDNDALMVDEIHDIRIIGVITLVILLVIAVVGMEWEARAQLGLLAILIVAMVNFAIGSFIPPSEKKKAQGFVGYNGIVFQQNLLPDFRDGESFFSVFSVFFPAATGILAGANISGDLRDAQSAIPKGTMLAILISSVIYILVAWMLGACALRDATGFVHVLDVDNSSLVNSSSQVYHYTIDTIANCSLAKKGVCKFGLLNNSQVMEMISGFGPLVTAGIFAATLSSALASIMSAPKVFQAVCKDKIFPHIHVFAKGYGKNNDPRLGYLLTFFIGLAFVLIGSLNDIAPIISNFFLMSYSLINYSCFDASLAKSPGWRPAFKYYSKWISLLGALLCLAVMFIINWWTALITFAVVMALYVYVHYTKPDVNWGSSTQAHVYRNALQSTLKLMSVEEHVKNFRPQVLVMTGYPHSRPALVDFAADITKNISLMVCGHILEGSQAEHQNSLRASSSSANIWLHKRKIKAFYTASCAASLRQGSQNLMQCVGIGKMRPNTLLIGFKNNWRTDSPQRVADYFHVIHDAFDLHLGVGILRLQEGFDCNISLEDSVPEIVEEELVYDEPSLTPNITPSMERKAVKGDVDVTYEPSTGTNSVHLSVSSARKPEPINKDLLKAMNRFHRKQKKGTIDVWWLFDDGGLTLLIPYILSTKSHWASCKLRVFTAGSKKGELDREQRQMVSLLNKFRIDVTDMVVIPDVGKPPREDSKKEFNSLLQGWVVDASQGETKDACPWKTTEDELILLKDKTNRHIRLKELLTEHSSDASLIVMTLPMPRKGTCSTALYMAWVDTLTKDLPPILLLRGNQTSVLTYYS
ncbi:solute carrier family 12 member 2-like [Liolophura sinensis]|uniref:solute carrier family 12 member 2-like n=1 Tax=Liolophura sinensis TaxID=3198878 RepID=UPI0031580032